MKMLSTTDYVNNNFKTITKMKDEKLMPAEVEKVIEGLKIKGTVFKRIFQ